MVVFYVPEIRKTQFEHPVTQKLNYLQQHPYISKPILAFPDFGDDGLGLNGISFESQEVVFPMGAGKDVGCGFRVLKIQSSRVDREKIEREFDVFASEVTSLCAGISISSREIQLLCNDNQTGFDWERKTRLSYERLANSFARIAKGNHFIEFRWSKTANAVTDEGDLIIHIHSGGGVFAEETMLEYLSLFYEGQEETFNGYQSYRFLRDDLAKDYLSDASRLLKYTSSNREMIQRKIANWLQVPIECLFDTAHDNMTIQNSTIRYCKAVQTYADYKGHEIAVIPTTISQNSLLVQKKGDFPWVNHGVGDGKSGKPMQCMDVLTNFNHSSKRTFFDTDTVLSLCHELDWFEVLTELTPWICIKNVNAW